MKGSHIQFKQYFLGNLDEKASEGISLQIISDLNFEEELRIAESELIEDFLDQNLTPEEVKLFHANFLVCDDRINELKELSLLKNYARTHRLTEQTIKTENDSPNFFEIVKSFFVNYARPVTAVLAILIIGLMIGLGWRLLSSNSNSGLSPLEQEYAQLNKKDLSNEPVTAVSLASSTLRDSNSAKKIAAENMSEKVFFRLALPFQITGAEFLKAEVLASQKTIFTQNQLRIYQSQNGQEIKLLLPKSILPKGSYQIKLENPSAKDSPITYSFVVD